MRRSVVTGAGRGLGLEFVRQLLDTGGMVWATARRPEASEGLTALQQTHGDRLSCVALDVSDPASIARGRSTSVCRARRGRGASLVGSR